MDDNGNSVPMVTALRSVCPYATCGGPSRVDSSDTPCHDAPLRQPPPEGEAEPPRRLKAKKKWEPPQWNGQVAGSFVEVGSKGTLPPPPALRAVGSSTLRTISNTHDPPHANLKPPGDAKARERKERQEVLVRIHWPAAQHPPSTLTRWHASWFARTHHAACFRDTLLTAMAHPRTPSASSRARREAL